jgi:photosystem II stability/assembly factor-like uncharacterized protein
VAAAVPTPTPQRYANFWFTSPKTGYALASRQPMRAGNLGVAYDLYRTTDSAATWKRLSLPSQPSSSKGYAYLQPMSDGGLVMGITTGIVFTFQYWLSSDAGATWREIKTPAQADQQSLQALDSRTFVILRRPLTNLASTLPLTLSWTHDAGVTWEQVLQLDADHPTAGALDIRQPYQGPTFVDDRHGWSMTDLPPRAVPRVLSTDDGGRTWTGVQLPEPGLGRGYANPVFPGGGRHGYLGAYSEVGLYLYESWDGGGTWSPPYPTHVDWFAVASDRWVAHNAAEVLTSHDWGRTWAHVSPRLPRGSGGLGTLIATGSVLWSLPFNQGPDSSAELMRSGDGGRTWTRARWPGA